MEPLKMPGTILDTFFSCVISDPHHSSVGWESLCYSPNMAAEA